MPFKPGEIHTEGGRKGYEFERRQFTKMAELLEKYLEVAERILTDKEKPNDGRKVQLLSADMRKVLDKLHASKQETETTIKLPQSLIGLLMYAKRSSGESIDLVAGVDTRSDLLLPGDSQNSIVGQGEGDPSSS